MSDKCAICGAPVKTEVRDVPASGAVLQAAFAVYDPDAEIRRRVAALTDDAIVGLRQSRAFYDEWRAALLRALGVRDEK